jgi:hypothetical protein
MHDLTSFFTGGEMFVALCEAAAIVGLSLVAIDEGGK